MTGSNSSLTAFPTPYINETKIDAIGLFTGQIGYAWNNVLWYVKGGAAVTDNRYRSFFTGTGVVFNQTDETRWGGAELTADQATGRVVAALGIRVDRRPLRGRRPKATQPRHL